MSTDNEVMERSAVEPAEFAILYDRHATSVYRYAAQRLGNDAAQDIVSETFLVAFERRASYDLTVRDARPWFLGIATRLMRKHARLEAVAWKGMASDLAARMAPDVIESAGHRIDAERLTRRLEKALRRLSSGDRDTLLLHAWEELDHASIAAVTGVPIGTVKSRLNRARRLLRHAAGTISQEQEDKHGRTDAAPQRS